MRKFIYAHEANQNHGLNVGAKALTSVQLSELSEFVYG